ncbi:N-succinyl-L,L-diaminopimelate desuccinylase [Bathymodiolus thermophilus thioautotrophic gill symbiont]|uniref:Succinyl-diaminopimelate desuccinylase n=1 Tax=Bathymodiolus thermophilus thioautotrophic gill symbiont TaxID=2360 RepID=A0A1J5U4Y8_9GAMM|nr:succinyl-diaminopimelate desuccinylase [Bathymodiolus thermophilus thioautotrophic gill symbiont]OIR23862.1 succinyl-diaminopimelate desuccinylase [Bathymodiolus thermophilus thioautotrophic gill symbiont]CAB5502256.1 N-succinyl-L,L-diaminopimelate desuccinylase (EC [Bathymodiolus thermophilus thioautotrophic gill symbiont]CAB5504931.1 N-succinyl-L,L-diaminopimelate desuccinylase (EC [Bathymodiolus thermophilus thioautotrophic gill symbiont]SGZ90816.1 N-succinyl-L,L-diaminopimelate desucciny
MTNSVLQLAKELISIDSITPNDKGCQILMTDRLKKIGFKIDDLKFGEVDNFWAKRGDHSPTFVFAGHTDVVPTGEHWNTDPFKPEVIDGLLYGRGTADMKGSLAAMIIATERFVEDFPAHKGSIGFLITADEEGIAVEGTVKVCEYLKAQNQAVDYCLVGEPSSSKQLGDVIKNGRRGSLNGTLTLLGKQGHIAYPHLANNPIHLLAPALNSLIAEVWDEGNDYFPATSFQVSNVHSGTGVTNVIPGEVEMVFNFRYSTASTHEGLQKRVGEILDAHGLEYKIDWNHSGYPFLTPKGDLVSACTQAIKTVKGIDSELSTSGGTSDGRFIAPILDAQVVELGPLNATIHQVDECVSVKDLEDLSVIYYQILKNILL